MGIVSEEEERRLEVCMRIYHSRISPQVLEKLFEQACALETYRPACRTEGDRKPEKKTPHKNGID